MVGGDLKLKAIMLCLSCKAKQDIEPQESLEQIRLVSNEDIDSIIKLLELYGSHCLVQQELSTTTKPLKPAVRKVEGEPFTKTTWEQEISLLDSRFCSETVADIQETLKDKSKHDDYVQANLYVKDQREQENSKSVLYRAMKKARKDEWELRFMRTFHDLSSSTLFFIHRAIAKSTGTKGHLDWCRARNILFGLHLTVSSRYFYMFICLFLDVSMNYAGWKNHQ